MSGNPTDDKTRTTILWALVVAFYCALHYVDAILKNRGENSTHHRPYEGKLQASEED